jgi:hypothetical protein
MSRSFNKGDLYAHQCVAQCVDVTLAPSVSILALQPIVIETSEATTTVISNHFIAISLMASEMLALFTNRTCSRRPWER